MKLTPSRRAWLILVNEDHVTFEISTLTKMTAVWKIDGNSVSHGRPSRDLDWLWAAGVIEFTRKGYPTMLRPTKVGRQILEAI